MNFTNPGRENNKLQRSHVYCYTYTSTVTLLSFTLTDTISVYSLWDADFIALQDIFSTYQIKLTKIEKLNVFPVGVDNDHGDEFQDNC